LSGGFTGSTWLQAIGVVFAASQAAYHLWWKNSDIAGWIEKNFNVIAGNSSSPPLGGAPGGSGGAINGSDA
jgi:hypothetical protein